MHTDIIFVTKDKDEIYAEDEDTVFSYNEDRFDYVVSFSQEEIDGRIDSFLQMLSGTGYAEVGEDTVEVDGEPLHKVRWFRPTSVELSFCLLRSHYEKWLHALERASKTTLDEFVSVGFGGTVHELHMHEDPDPVYVMYDSSIRCMTLGRFLRGIVDEFSCGDGEKDKYYVYHALDGHS